MTRRHARCLDQGGCKFQLVGQSRPTTSFDDDVLLEQSHTDLFAHCPAHRAQNIYHEALSKDGATAWSIPVCPDVTVSSGFASVGSYGVPPPEGEDVPTGSPRTRSSWKRGRERKAIEGGQSFSSLWVSPATSGLPACPREDGVTTAPSRVAFPCWAVTFELAQPVRRRSTGSVYLHGL